MATVGERTPTAPTQDAIRSTTARKGLTVPRVFSDEGISPFDQVEWDIRTAEIKDDRGQPLFTQTDCEFPKFWSQLSTNVVASKYFYGENGTAERERSVRQLIHRVTRTIADWGIADGYFATKEDGERFYDELTALCLFQYGSFNSPVWFNVGLYHQYGIAGSSTNWRWDEETRTVVQTNTAYEFPQGSACFIQSVQDDMADIMRLATSEAMLFKYGSGTGTDLSTLRSSKEKLAGGGRPSGPVSFMKVYDAIASVVKSGGKTRRAAKMQTLKVWHPDIVEFIECKVKEERKAHALIRQGYDANFNGEAYSSVMFQNANLSVRATDAFLRAVEEDGEWVTYAVTTGKPMGVYRARDLMERIAQSAWQCGDPGMQYEDTIQRWHTCPNTAPINSSNPCSEYMFIDDSACNLASINLMKFRREDGTFDVERFRAACRIYLTAQEILVDHVSYPTDRIALNSHRFRPLGLGYANLGSLIMASGRAYDSEAGRALAAGITAVMHGEANLTSARIAAHLGPFEGFAVNREPMLKVMEMHRDAVERIDPTLCPANVLEAARAVWKECLEMGREHGFRNSQVTVIAPTGTISFMMDCDTTGIEPDIALVKYKNLAGGGMLKIVNRTVPLALKTLGYDDEEIKRVLAHVDAHDTVEGAPDLKPEHLDVFDCAFKPSGGQRSIPYLGHIKMMAAVQPFLSGAISKTVNMPRESTVEDVMGAYLTSWKLGLKAIAIYRDGSKESQPLTTSRETSHNHKEEKGKEQGLDTVSPKDHETDRTLAENSTVVAPPKPTVGEASHQVSPSSPPPTVASAPGGALGPRRERLPETRRSLTHKFDIQGHEGYITVGFYDDGRPGELFITMAKEGSTIGGLMDVLGTAISIGLQYGVPLEVFVNKFAHSRFEPSGFTRNPEIPIAKSITDYIFRWLGMQFIPGYREANTPKRDEPVPTDLHAPKSISGAALEPPVAQGWPVAPSPSDPWVRAEPSSASMVKTSGHRTPIAEDAILAPRFFLMDMALQRRQFAQFQSDAPSCDVCGALTVRCGTCYRCFNCGNSMGCG
ncbi:ribonucleoside-diphosphate reductase, adenosylcobalamin-dependent [Isosphaera pallida ATCC 43644]|uniref:Vitamin B12-dependent ribonucleotide reductase n=1 Tax=Isosphaera pallida (strain ATCC 43644 / DSM 9630 / IS1B) TaxID=575540 RepID=E8QZP0_ISOPI|nr:vitamin B12-dependent ribonucleotide reductase [Isosphaera pallida]ADV62176.1 ribonucleoside-diphosphate reductase, adenosylcobalamin-dependent [Isosphaera pallida ATCC 43644]